jgi:UDPglucose--hexose-1-phosphate uridylyltransferase
VRTIAAATLDEIESCPFCAGREQLTPPESLRLGSPSWQVRVFPNRYPAFERQEVVVHSPTHVRTLAELADDRLALVAEACQARAHDARSGGFAYVHAFVNEGGAAGASLAHSHSQLVSLPEPPPVVAEEQSRLRGRDCVLCRLTTSALADERYLVAESEGVALLTHPAGRAPYELLIAPFEHSEQALAGTTLLVRALELLAEGVRRLRRLEGAVAWNAWLHDGGHWHFEVVPRLTVFGGAELGAGIYVNTVAPEQAAAALRAAGQSQR